MYRVGDVVLIQYYAEDAGEEFPEEMSHWLGCEMTIKRIAADGTYRMEEDSHENFGDGWVWLKEDFIGLVSELENVMDDIAPEDILAILENKAD